jgi:hypothetical protein
LPPGAKKLDDRDLVTFEEMLMANSKMVVTPVHFVFERDLFTGEFFVSLGLFLSLGHSE